MSTTKQPQITSRQFSQWWHHHALRFHLLSRRRHQQPAPGGRHQPTRILWISRSWKPFHIPKEVQEWPDEYWSTTSPPEDQKCKNINNSQIFHFFLYRNHIFIFQCTVLLEDSRLNYLEAEGKFSHFDHRRHIGMWTCLQTETIGGYRNGFTHHQLLEV